MKATLTLMAFVAPFVVLADSIAYGFYRIDGFIDQEFMWIEGPDPCPLGRIGAGFATSCNNEGGLNICIDNTDNPCGHEFILENGKGYKLENCGTDCVFLFTTTIVGLSLALQALIHGLLHVKVLKAPAEFSRTGSSSVI